MWGEIDQNVVGGAAAAIIYQHLSWYGDLTGDTKHAMTDGLNRCAPVTFERQHMLSKWSGNDYIAVQPETNLLVSLH